MTGEKFRCTSYPAATKSLTAAMRSSIRDVRMSTSVLMRRGISEKRRRVLRCGS